MNADFEATHAIGSVDLVRDDRPRDPSEMNTRVTHSAASVDLVRALGGGFSAESLKR